MAIVGLLEPNGSFIGNVKYGQISNKGMISIKIIHVIMFLAPDGQGGNGIN